MIQTAIKSLSLTSEVANFAYENICADNFREDVSFTATLRALLVPRGGKLRAIYSNSSANGATEGSSDDGFLNAVKCDAQMGADELKIVNTTDTSGKYIAQLMTHLEEVLPGFVYGEMVSKRMSKFCGAQDEEITVRVFVNQQEHKTLLVVQNMSMFIWHAIQSGLTLYVPWLFAESPTQQEMKMLLALVDPGKSSADYTAAVEEIAAGFDLQNAAKRYYLKDFESQGYEEQLGVAKRNVETTERRIREWQESLSSEYDKRASYLVVLNALLSSGADDRHELMDYFLSNQKLYVKEVSGKQLTYFVSGFCDNWDPNTMEDCWNNPNSAIWSAYGYGNGKLSKDEYGMLLSAIFREERIKLKMVSCWNMSYGGGVSPVSHAEYPVQFADCLPNPHLHYHACMGSWASSLDKAAMDMNYTLLVDLTSAENGNVNFGDATVMSEFGEDLLNTDKKCFVLPDGSSVTNREAVDWLKANA